MNTITGTKFQINQLTLTLFSESGPKSPPLAEKISKCRRLYIGLSVDSLIPILWRYSQNSMGYDLEKTKLSDRLKSEVLSHGALFTLLGIRPENICFD